MTVCFVSHDAGLGGASRALIELVDALQNLGIRCRVVVPGKGRRCDKVGLGAGRCFKRPT